jgi:hypothetical protein
VKCSPLSTALILVSASGCNSSPPASPATPPPRTVEFTLELTDPADPSADELRSLVRAGAAEVEAFFGLPFVALFEVVGCEDRATFDASFPPEWASLRPRAGWSPRASATRCTCAT